MISSSELSVPKHIAIIMDGNGRWARSRGKDRRFGHEQGAVSIQHCLEGCVELGVEYLTLYAFSNENWKRPAYEVNALMNLLGRFLKEKTNELTENNIRLKAIGRLHALPNNCQQQLHRTMEATSKNTGLTLILALSYGGREEIIDGVKKVLQDYKSNRLDEESLTSEIFSKYLYTAPYPDPDLFIRTSGEMRVSNFLLWQISYTEIYFSKKLWPDFRKEDLLDAVKDFSSRQRRYGLLEETSA